MNTLHGWTCPTCGAERGECDVASGTPPAVVGLACFDGQEHLWNVAVSVGTGGTETRRWCSRCWIETLTREVA